jgi:hypothetical protein
MDPLEVLAAIEEKAAHYRTHAAVVLEGVANAETRSEVGLDDLSVRRIACEPSEPQ